MITKNTCIGLFHVNPIIEMLYKKLILTNKKV